ncbi:MAG: efflux RND transporter periplasmic adaptor subunit [Acidobacteriota bacterium]|nr:efflux RND transporter periplasmic adaptor subunit [Acidobacteriota bacterium]
MDRPISDNTRRRRLIKQIAVVVLALAGVWLVASLGAGLLRVSISRGEIRTATVERGIIEDSLQASGVLTPESETMLTSSIDSRVLKILKAPGTEIAPGEAILELDTSSAVSELDKLTEELSLKENKKRLQELELEKFRKTNKGQMDLLLLDLEFLRTRYKQQKSMADKGLISSEELLQARLNVDKKLVEKRQLEENRQDEAAVSKARLAELDLEISILEKTRETLARDLERARAMADRTGVLTWVVEEEGASVRKGDPIARIADMTSFKVEASISDFHASRLHAGQKARVDINGDLLDGRVTKLLPAVEDGILKFEVAFDNPGITLRTNMRVDVYVVLDRKAEVLRLKKGPAVNGAGTHRVFVIREDTAYRTTVRAGASGKDHYEIVDGLNEGDEVIISDSRSWIHMEKVPVKR